MRANLVSAGAVPWTLADAPCGLPGFTSTFVPSTCDSVEPGHHRDHHRNDHERDTDHEDSLNCTHTDERTPVYDSCMKAGLGNGWSEAERYAHEQYCCDISGGVWGPAAGSG